MIEKVANNKSNQEELNLNPSDEIKEKLSYYRSLFGKIHDFNDEEFESLKKDISKFFNLKPVRLAKEAPERLVRISNNNRILNAQGKKLSYLTDISHLLAPPLEFCKFGRCNLPNQQVLYCAIDETSAYWETKPQKGDIITISHFKLKKGAQINCSVISTEKIENPNISHQLEEVYYLLEDFFVDAFSFEVDRNRTKDYIFSALLSSEQLFYPISSKDNIEAIIYPSVQRKKFGHNLAIRNDLIFEKYELIGVETRFILEEYENLDPSSSELTSDNLIGSFGTEVFDFHKGKILYNEKAPEIFKLFRNLQTNGGKQVRYDNTDNIKTLAFNLSPKIQKVEKQKLIQKVKISRNERINVIYKNGMKKEGVKYKFVKEDLDNGDCQIVN